MKQWFFQNDPCSMQVYLLLLMSPLRQFFRPVSEAEADRHCDTWSDLCEHAAQWAHDNAGAEELTTLQSARCELKNWLHDCCGVERDVLNAATNAH